MFSRTDLEDRSRVDVSAILEQRGLAVVDAMRLKPCERWLARHGYERQPLDLGTDFPTVLASFGKLLSWEEQFGYPMEEGQGNLNALADGFEFDVPDGGLVLELLNPERVFREHKGWLMGLLSIASEHSLRQLALGRRFFTLVVVEKESPLIGAEVETLTVPRPYWNPSARRHGFLE